MDEKYANAREYLFIAIRSLAASADSLESRLISATASLVQITIDQFDGDPELKLRFARILDHLGVDQDDLETVAIETATHITEIERIKIAELICDLFYDL